MVAATDGRDPFVPAYRIALAAYCVLTALWLPDGAAALVGSDDGALRLVHLTTGAVQGYYSALVKGESGAACTATWLPINLTRDACRKYPYVRCQR